jgi:hypothetical protein
VSFAQSKGFISSNDEKQYLFVKRFYQRHRSNNAHCSRLSSIICVTVNISLEEYIFGVLMQTCYMSFLASSVQFFVIFLITKSNLIYFSAKLVYLASRVTVK